MAKLEAFTRSAANDAGGIAIKRQEGSPADRGRVCLRTLEVGLRAFHERRGRCSLSPSRVPGPRRVRFGAEVTATSGLRASRRLKVGVCRPFAEYIVRRRPHAGFDSRLQERCRGLGGSERSLSAYTSSRSNATKPPRKYKSPTCPVGTLCRSATAKRFLVLNCVCGTRTAMTDLPNLYDLHGRNWRRL